MDDNPQGFFLLVEHEGSDESGHANDLAGVISAIVELDQAVQTALYWATGRSHTLIVVLSDHETGGLEVLESEPTAGQIPSHRYTTTGHSNANVPIFAWGVGVECVSEIMDNTEVFGLLNGCLSGP